MKSGSSCRAFETALRNAGSTPAWPPLAHCTGCQLFGTSSHTGRQMAYRSPTTRFELVRAADGPDQSAPIGGTAPLAVREACSNDLTPTLSPKNGRTRVLSRTHLLGLKRPILKPSSMRVDSAFQIAAMRAPAPFFRDPEPCSDGPIKNRMKRSSPGCLDLSARRQPLVTDMVQTTTHDRKGGDRDGMVPLARLRRGSRRPHFQMVLVVHRTPPGRRSQNPELGSRGRTSGGSIDPGLGDPCPCSQFSCGRSNSAF